MKKCIYCRNDIPQESVIDFCEKCGVGVWGHKMFKAIVDQMNSAKDRGDLNQGLVNDTLNKEMIVKSNNI